MVALLPISTLQPDEGDGLDDVLQLTVAGIVGLDPSLVRPRWQTVPASEPMRSVNWCAIGAQNLIQDAGPYFGQDGDQTSMQRHLLIEAMASFYGPAARTNAGLLRDGLSVEANRYILRSVGIGIHSLDSTIRMPELIGMEWRDRVDFSFSLTRQIDRVYPVKRILTAILKFN